MQQTILLGGGTILGALAGYHLGRFPAGRLLLYLLGHPLKRSWTRDLYTPWYFGPSQPIAPCILTGALYGLVFAYLGHGLLRPEPPYPLALAPHPRRKPRRRC